MLQEHSPAQALLKTRASFWSGLHLTAQIRAIPVPSAVRPVQLKTLARCRYTAVLPLAHFTTSTTLQRARALCSTQVLTSLTLQPQALQQSTTTQAVRLSVLISLRCKLLKTTALLRQAHFRAHRRLPTISTARLSFAVQPAPAISPTTVLFSVQAHSASAVQLTTQRTSGLTTAATLPASLQTPIPVMYR